MSALIIMVIALPMSYGCAGFQAPPSKEAGSEIRIFNSPVTKSVFDDYGFLPAELAINSDGSGHIFFYIESGTVGEKKSAIETAIREINEKAYSEGDYQEGYRLVWVQDKNITQEGENVAVVVEFKDINFFKTDVKLQTLGEYLDGSSDPNEKNNFTDASTKKTTSVVNIQNKEDYKLLTLNYVPSQIPIRVNGSVVSAYYLEGGEGSDVVEVSRDTIKTSQAHYKVLFRQDRTSQTLIIIAALFGASFSITLTIKLIIDNNRRKSKTIEIRKPASKSK